MLYQPVFSGINLAGGNEPEYVEGAKVSFDFFRVVGVEPVIGRGFTPQEDRPGGEPVAVLSADLWQRRFGGDAERDRPHGVDQRATSHRRRRHAAGICWVPEFLSKADIFVPLRPSMRGRSRIRHYLMVWHG